MFLTGVLPGALELADARALTAVVIYEIPKAKLAAILRERPAVVEELGALLTSREKTEQAIHGREVEAPNPPPLSSRIRHFFLTWSEIDIFRQHSG